MLSKKLNDVSGISEEKAINLKEIQIETFSTSNVNPKYLLHYNNSHFEVGRPVADLIIAIKNHELFDDCLDAYGRKYSKTQEEVKGLIKLLETSLLKSRKSDKTNSFIYNVEIVSAKGISKVSNALIHLFNPYITSMVVLITTLLHCLFYLDSTNLNLIGDFDLYTVFSLFAFFLISSFIHELGHASACKYYNKEHGGIGFGLYLNLPVFYTDVSGIWTLPRKKRCVVNMSGIYFQLILLLPFLILSNIFEEQIISYIIISTNINFLMTLNPFFKFDGYWLMSDILGVPNLRQRSNELLKYYVNKFRKVKTRQPPFLLQLNRKVKAIAITYTILVNAFFAYYFLYIIPLFFINFFRTFPPLLSDIFWTIVNGDGIDFNLVQKIAIQVLFFLLTIYIVFKVLGQMVKALRWRRAKC